jgi:hypothetical protein
MCAYVQHCVQWHHVDYEANRGYEAILSYMMPRRVVMSLHASMHAKENDSIWWDDSTSYAGRKKVTGAVHTQRNRHFNK